MATLFASTASVEKFATFEELALTKQGSLLSAKALCSLSLSSTIPTQWQSTDGCLLPAVARDDSDRSTAGSDCICKCARSIKRQHAEHRPAQAPRMATNTPFSQTTADDLKLRVSSPRWPDCHPTPERHDMHSVDVDEVCNDADDDCARSYEAGTDIAEHLDTGVCARTPSTKPAVDCDKTLVERKLQQQAFRVRRWREGACKKPQSEI